jgi:hypothetical protein
MTREKEIKRRLFEISTSNFNNSVVDSSAYFAGYIDGARWADEHPHWISVEDEMPKNKELVFITDGEYTDTGFYEYTFDEWQPCEKWLGDITHWMPLPQAPKKGGEE